MKEEWRPNHRTIVLNYAQTHSSVPMFCLSYALGNLLSVLVEELDDDFGCVALIELFLDVLGKFLQALDLSGPEE